jgi:hypothetical protein
MDGVDITLSTVILGNGGRNRRWDNMITESRSLNLNHFEELPCSFENELWAFLW